MNQGTTSSGKAFDKLHPTDILDRLYGSRADGCLRVSHGSVSYFLYFARGELIYATNSVDPFERLERHLRRLSFSNRSLTSDMVTQARLDFETDSATDNNPEYEAICWLVDRQYIKQTEGAQLVENLTQEVLETYLLLSQLDDKNVIFSGQHMLRELGLMDSQKLLERCCERLQAWQALNPQISSSYQRAYFFNNAYAKNKIPPEQRLKLGSALKGFNFRQLGVMLNKDELVLARKLHRLVIRGAVILREPQPPYDKLPIISEQSVEFIASRNNSQTLEDWPTDTDEVKTDLSFSGIDNAKGLLKTYTIACVDDSPTTLQEINRCLDNDKLKVFLINDSVQALMKIIEIAPDLILLDVGMPNVDGYQLCSLLRKNPSFKKTPIVMVTGNNGFLDRAKAKLAGSTDYMVKPFNQAELLKMVFRYLT